MNIDRNISLLNSRHQSSSDYLLQPFQEILAVMKEQQAAAGILLKSRGISCCIKTMTQCAMLPTLQIPTECRSRRIGKLSLNTYHLPELIQVLSRQHSQNLLIASHFTESKGQRIYRDLERVPHDLSSILHSTPVPTVFFLFFQPASLSSLAHEDMSQ